MSESITSTILSDFSLDRDQTEFNSFEKECYSILIKKGHTVQELHKNTEYFRECFENKVPLSMAVSYYKSVLTK